MAHLEHSFRVHYDPPKCPEKTSGEGDTIVRKYQRLIFHAVVFIIFDEHYDYDIAQEAFIRVRDQLSESLDPDDPQLQAYLLKTARNLASNFLRDRKRKCRDARRNLPLDTGIQIIADGPGLSTVIDRPQKESDVQIALGRLRGEARLIIQLRYSEELTYAEIGKILGKSEDAISKAVHRILARLQKDPNLWKWANRPRSPEGEQR